MNITDLIFDSFDESNTEDLLNIIIDSFTVSNNNNLVNNKYTLNIEGFNQNSEIQNYLYFRRYNQETNLSVIYKLVEEIHERKLYPIVECDNFIIFDNSVPFLEINFSGGSGYNIYLNISRLINNIINYKEGNYEKTLNDYFFKAWCLVGVFIIGYCGYLYTPWKYQKT